MKKVKATLVVLSILFAFQAVSQVAINATGSLAHSSSMLDVSSDTLGLLMPRMTAVQRDAITSPATGLIVFVTDNNQFYYYDGTQWAYLDNHTRDAIWDADSTTGIQAEKLPNEDHLHFYTNGSEKMVINKIGDVGIGIFSPAERVHVYKGMLTEGTVNTLLKLEGQFTQEFLDTADIIGISFAIQSQASGVNYMPYALNGEGDVLIAKDGNNVGIGTISPDYKLDVSGNVAANNIVSTIPLWQGSEYTMTNTSGQDLSNCESALIPVIYASGGLIDVKLVIRVKSTTAGTNSFQLRTHNGTTESFPIVHSDTWTWTTVQTGYAVESEWKSFTAGTTPMEVHLYGWVDTGQTIFNSVYLLVRPHQY